MQQEKGKAHRNEQLFSIGEEKAIADYAGIMANAGFPLNPDLLWQIAQGIVNERQISQHGQRGVLQVHNNLRDQRNLRLQRHGAIITPDNTTSTRPPIHIVGIHWVDRFLEWDSGFKKFYIRYQERARAAATNDTELQADLLWKLANLIRRG